MNNIKPYIVKHLEASTIHITETDNSLLNKIASHCEESILSVESTMYGYIIHIDEELEKCIIVLDEEGFSISFCNLLRLAEENKCIYLTLDCDGYMYDKLPTFDW